MGWLFIDGCEDMGYSLPSTYGDGNVGSQSSVKRTGDYAYQCNVSGAAEGRVHIRTWSATGETGFYNVATAYYRFYFRYGTKPAANDEPIFVVRATDLTNKAELRINSSGNLVLYNSAISLINTGSSVLSVNTWYRIELKIGTGTSAAYELLVDGDSELSGTADLSFGNNGEFVIGKYPNRNSNTVNYYYDDIAVRDDGWCGVGGVLMLRPNANGSLQEWTGSYADIDEVPRSLGDYVVSTAANQTALFGFEDTTGKGISGTINAIDFRVIIAETGTGASNVTHRVKSSSSNSDSTAFEVVSEGSSEQRGRVIQNDPATSVAWTTSGLDAIEAGMVENVGSACRVRIYWAGINVDFVAGGASAVPIIEHHRRQMEA